MTQILKGGVVAEKIRENCINDIKNLKNQGITPQIGIIRVGERADDVYYENSIIKNCEKIDLAYQLITLNVDINQAALEEQIKKTAENPAVHGIFFFSPLPKHLDETAARALIPVEKDIDCLTVAGAAKIFIDDDSSFPPCTPAAVMETLDFYNIPLAGKNVVILGRSMVVGKPLAMLMLRENATVTICHSKTVDLPNVCQKADILVAAVGRAKMVDETYVRAEQTVIDVGINSDPDNAGKMCGDVNFAKVSEIVEKITPVPAGIGSVTTAVLLKHVVKAAGAVAEATATKN